jgi:hypothetical protein
MTTSKGLHITVGHALSAGQATNFSLVEEARLIKAAILYGDSVSVYGLRMHKMLDTAKSSELLKNESTQFDEFLKIMRPRMSSDQLSTLDNIVQKREQLTRKRSKTRPEHQLLNQLNKQIQDMMGNTLPLQKQLEDITNDAGVDEILLALKSGIVKFVTPSAYILQGPSSTTPDSDFLVEQFVDWVLSIVKNPNTYPLFDETTAAVVRGAIKEGKLQQVDVKEVNAKRIGISSGLMSQLPVIIDAPMDEVLGARQALARPLVRFRQAVIGYEQQVESAAWDEGFHNDASDLFHRIVAPSIEEIREAMEDNRLIRRVSPTIFSKPFAASTTILSLGLTAASQFAGGLLDPVQIGALASTTSAALQVYEEWNAKQRDISKNQLFFLYQLQRRLE